MKSDCKNCFGYNEKLGKCNILIKVEKENCFAFKTVEQAKADFEAAEKRLKKLGFKNDRRKSETNSTV